MKTIPENILRCIGTCSYGLLIAQYRRLEQAGSTTSPPCFGKSIFRRLSDKVIERLVDIKEDQFEARK
uniref:Uncharacterized protein n=1 Tax=Lotus japonicus TaxID=34305 RepID=I3SSX8_LOTJA|nr:unknown [Lotus japonicus]